MRYNSILKTIRWFLAVESRIATDESFERPYGCWDYKAKNQFILDLFAGWVSSSFVLASVQDCLDYCQSIGDKNSVDWYTWLKQQGMRWVSLDSKHRRETIAEFYNGNLGLNGSFTDNNGKFYEFSGECYKDVPEELKRIFLDIHLPLSEYHSATRTDLARIFRGVNSGESPTAQHMRQALDTPLAPEIRNLARQCVNFEKIYAPKNRIKMKPHEDLGKIYLHCLSENSKISKEKLDELYAQGEGEGQRGKLHPAYDTVAWRKTVTICRQINRLSQDYKVRQGDVLLYAMAIKRLIESGYSITDYRKFGSAILCTDEALDRSSSSKYGKSRKPKTGFYFEWKRLNWGVTRFQRASALWGEISSNPTHFGVQKSHPAPVVAATVPAAPTPAP
jgi:hypothetical protein